MSLFTRIFLLRLKRHRTLELWNFTATTRMNPSFHKVTPLLISGTLPHFWNDQQYIVNILTHCMKLTYNDIFNKRGHCNAKNTKSQRTIRYRNIQRNTVSRSTRGHNAISCHTQIPPRWSPSCRISHYITGQSSTTRYNATRHRLGIKPRHIRVNT